MADDARGKTGERKEPPDDEAALSARLQRLGDRLASANRPSENDTGPRQTADHSAMARGFRLSTELVAGVVVGAACLGRIEGLGERLPGAMAVGGA